MGGAALVPRVAENGAVLLSPLFAGRGRVRGLGDWPLGSRLSRRQMITMVCSKRPGSFSSVATHPRPSPDLSPQRGGERGSDLPNCQRRAELEPLRVGGLTGAHRRATKRRENFPGCRSLKSRETGKSLPRPLRPAQAGPMLLPSGSVGRPQAAHRRRAQRVTSARSSSSAPLTNSRPSGFLPDVSRRHPAEESGVASAIPAPKAQPPRKRSGQWTVG
jgi:hypothetical protein